MQGERKSKFPSAKVEKNLIFPHGTPIKYYRNLPTKRFLQRNISHKPSLIFYHEWTQIYTLSKWLRPCLSPLNTLSGVQESGVQEFRQMLSSPLTPNLSRFVQTERRIKLAWIMQRCSRSSTTQLLTLIYQPSFIRPCHLWVFLFSHRPHKNHRNFILTTKEHKSTRTFRSPPVGAKSNK